ncbi:TetR/AcrR family transcriptional regulator [Herbaspirillum sp. YR522]|uniref:TetR/AcrR family transcriptional regulator n=1 Tax=Herbaspirillum sp. YR522 TaxID=1144342 RepID=UPI00026F9193|nr:TetR/AcrR family transcriptional regulator [Herbaspirillum sp. YR522]EJM96310.1 transcriptional regulator [Herbaspirillum sp. YR522]
MTSSSHVTEAVRRIPKQERAQRRIQDILRSADRLIGEKGLTGTTMTDIAQSSGTSIGAIYQYFPNKEMLVAAMRARCLEKLDALLSPLSATPAAPDITALAHALADLLVSFSAQCPAYRHLFFSTEPGFRHDADDLRLIKRFGKLFSVQCRALSSAQLAAVTGTAVIIIKGLLDVGARMQWERQGQLVDEIKFALASYLASRCRPLSDGA